MKVKIIAILLCLISCLLLPLCILLIIFWESVINFHFFFHYLVIETIDRLHSLFLNFIHRLCPQFIWYSVYNIEARKWKLFLVLVKKFDKKFSISAGERKEQFLKFRSFWPTKLKNKIKPCKQSLFLHFYKFENIYYKNL